MWRNIRPAFLMMVILTALTGFIYPGVVTALCRVLFPRQSRGSLVVRNGAIVGSELIGQDFTKPGYFHPRPSAAGHGYDPMASGGSNLGPANPRLVEKAGRAAERFRAENGLRGAVPADAATTSASGLDPHISPATAEAQVERVASARKLSTGQVSRVLADNTEGRTFGFLGEPRVNVLKLNLALDRQYGAP
jgi:K+-transporting ATPase ATPase C chain